ncbi:MAG: helix-turn-helix domain-containing protein [Candidatus Tectomicrobia bacterium]|nr:helix-turn-helix domain-containing protein [Candidatus Tectomicrobia bacterium]
MSEYWTIKELAAYLKIKVSTLYAKVAAREIPYHRIGRLVRFRKEDIDRWMDQHRHEPVDATQQAREPMKTRSPSALDLPRLAKQAIASVKGSQYTPRKRNLRPESLRGGKKHGTL